MRIYDILTKKLVMLQTSQWTNHLPPYLWIVIMICEKLVKVKLIIASFFIFDAIKTIKRTNND